MRSSFVTKQGGVVWGVGFGVWGVGWVSELLQEWAQVVPKLVHGAGGAIGGDWHGWICPYQSRPRCCSGIR